MELKANPITREEFERFIERCGEEAKSPKREIRILVHPRDLKATKQLFGEE